MGAMGDYYYEGNTYKVLVSGNGAHIFVKTLNHNEVYAYADDVDFEVEKSIELKLQHLTYSSDSSSSYSSTATLKVVSKNKIEIVCPNGNIDTCKRKTIEKLAFNTLTN